LVKVFSALAEGARILGESNVDTPRLDSEVLLSFVLGFDRVKLISEANLYLTPGQYNKFIELIRGRARGVPAAYLVGKKEFMGLDFLVRPGVLIPRGDTEIATERAILRLRERPGDVSAADVCCGSGAIGISIAKYVENSHVTLIDISETAVSIAAENAALNGVAGRISITKGDLLTGVEGKFDIIVSNPPYIPEHEIDKLQRDVRDFEPRIALNGGHDGLDFYRRLIPQAEDVLKEGGLIIMEIGFNQAADVSSILRDYGYTNIQVFKDLAGNDRCVEAVRPER
jgi:protein-(glutamine-N5) methyltransferase, release factor-specific